VNVLNMDRTPIIMTEWEKLSRGLRDEQGWPSERVQSIRPLFYYCMSVSMSSTVEAARHSGGPASQRFAVWLQNVGAEAETACFIALASRHTQPAPPRRRHPDWLRVAKLTMWASVALFLTAECAILARLTWIVLEPTTFCHGQGFKEVQ
jgi:hypothetical protein